MILRPTLHPFWDQVQRRALVVGAAGVVLCGVGVFFNPVQFFRSYLLAYLFWLGIPLGCLAILMLHHLVGGAWGALIRRVLEAGTRTLPLLVFLFVPLLFGVHELYLWARPEVVANDLLLQRKSSYLNIPFFMLRSALYFVVWLAVSYLLNKWSLRQDRTGADPFERRMRLLSGPGLVLYVVTATFAYVDWMMSLEPHWFSTIYGILAIVGQLLATLAFAVVVTALLVDAPPLSDLMSPGHVHDLGNLLLAFVMVWAYMAISQFLIIWSGNLPEEITWYLHRTQGGWEWVGLALILFYFGLPFFLLLSRGIKQHVQRLAWVAGAMLGMHGVDVFWRVVPAFQPSGVAVHWMDVAALMGVGGIWMAVFVWQLRERPLLPVYDPGLLGITPHE
ncbi:MAG TPA: hypothetical protein VLK82_23590 [Candidatus Tectomicrobia bacterium]|nr:hypothetical protein [Candidatus Tectomicrobia bacterium]